nr:recombinase family protein [Brevundimonas denitrificans]
MVLAAQYLRASTDKQRYSSQSQSAAIAAYAAREGLEIIRTYVDEARSGLTIRRRDGLKDLLQDVMDARRSRPSWSSMSVDGGAIRIRTRPRITSFCAGRRAFRSGTAPNLSKTTARPP